VDAFMGAGRIVVRIGVAFVGFSAIFGSVTGVAQADARTVLAAPSALRLSASSVSASRTIGVDAVQLRPDTTYQLISRRTRTDPSSSDVSESSDGPTVLALAKADSIGTFSMRFVVPLSWRHDHLIEVQKVKGADLVEHANDWITATPPRPALALGADTVHASSAVRVVVSGLRAHTTYEVFSGTTRMTDDPDEGGAGEDPPGLRSLRTDDNGRARLKITVPEDWRQDHLIEVRKKKGGNVAVGANAWLTVVR
jgi:hypothetical protein